MTKPTIEEMVEMVNLALEAWKPIDKNKYGDRAMEVFGHIRDYLIAHQANTLPLDEIPEGFVFSELRLRQVTFIAILLSTKSSNVYLSGPVYIEGIGRTQSDALRAAIAKVKEQSQ